MSTKSQDDEDKRCESELTDEELAAVAGGGGGAKTSRASYGAASGSDQAVTMTAIALAESGGNDG